MHANNFGMLKNMNLPVLDQVYPALIQDLDERGLLDSTLVVVMGEMGRSPRVNKAAGRDHWPQCGFSLLTGGGVREGMIHGATDRQAAYPISDPVHPADLVATIYHLLGIDPHLLVHDRVGRPFPVARGGEPLLRILA
jgi:arylsulfatase A-like enzyme